MTYFRQMPTNSLLVLKKTSLGLAIGWTILIGVLCLVSFTDLPSIKVKSADKYVHITFHFIFIMLWGFYSSLKQNGIRINKIVRLVLISIGYGIFIEILQETLTTTRHADIFDVMANLTGALLALLVFVLLKKRKAEQA